MQIDDAYLGGERNGGKPDRGSQNKQAFVIAVETNAELEHPRFAVIEPVRTFDNASITDWSMRRLAPRPMSTATDWARFVASSTPATHTPLPELVPQLLRAMVLCCPCPEPILRQASNFTG